VRRQRWYALAYSERVLEGGKSMYVDVFVDAIEQGRWLCDRKMKI
jgi:hypothetical protein